MDRIAARIVSTLIATGPSAQLGRDGIEEVAGRIARGVDAAYLGPYRELVQRHNALEDGVEQLEADRDAARDELEGLRGDAAKLIDQVTAWHHQQSDHRGWAICQHPICRATREFPWE